MPLFNFLVSVFVVEFSLECSAVVSPFIVHSVQCARVQHQTTSVKAASCGGNDVMMEEVVVLKQCHSELS